MKKNIILPVIFFVSLIVILNKDATQLIGINYSVSEYKIPLYLKLYNFYGRHLNYDYMVNTITKNSKSDIEKVISISKWVYKNIKKLPENVDIVDSHPLTIAERRLGTKDQFSDLLSVMLVYANIDAFMWYPQNDHKNALTIFKVDNNWSVIDPYYGTMFVNNKNKHASITELKSIDDNKNWFVHTLDNEEINKHNIFKVFGGKFNNINELKDSFAREIKKIPTQREINSTDIFKLGGRAHLQSPLMRLWFIVREIHS